MSDKGEKTQTEKFKDLARELETNEDEGAFDRALKKVAKTPKGPKRGAQKD